LRRARRLSFWPVVEFLSSSGIFPALVLAAWGECQAVPAGNRAGLHHL